MSIADLLSVLSFGLACFSIGYAFGKDKSTKKPANKSQVLFLAGFDF